MHVAEFLSDLTSLQVCVCFSGPVSLSTSNVEQDPEAALALVSARPDNGSQSNGTSRDVTDDPDLKRAKDLLHLHSDVKVARPDGVDKDLNQAREAVAKVLRSV